MQCLAAESEVQTSRGAKMHRNTKEKWKCDDTELIGPLKAQFGEAPRHLSLTVHQPLSFSGSKRTVLRLPCRWRLSHGLSTDRKSRNHRQHAHRRVGGDEWLH